MYATIAGAKEALRKHVPGLVLVDWNMPDGQGDALCRFIRSNWNDLPLIFLTVRDDSRDVIFGFQSGADDYVVKPFELDVLYSRICALLRRTGNVSEQYLSCDSISLDQSRMMVFCEGEEISLSPMEYELLLLLLKNKGKTVTRAEEDTYIRVLGKEGLDLAGAEELEDRILKSLGRNYEIESENRIGEKIPMTI